MKILHIDIETAPNLATVWGIFNQNIGINQLLETSRVLCYAAKWHGKRSMIFDSELNTRREEMIQGLWELLDEADVICHYNGKRFDIPSINREFLMLGMTPPSPYKQVDLLQTVRKQFRFVSNKLDHVMQELKLGRKVEHAGHQLWLDCMLGDAKAWRTMEKYNKQDVKLLEKLYIELLPWIKNHPNYALYLDTDRPVCTNCGSEHVQSRGTAITKSQKYLRFQCQDCGTWLRGRYSIVDKDKREHILTQEV